MGTRITNQEYTEALEIVEAFETQDIEGIAKNCKYKLKLRIKG